MTKMLKFTDVSQETPNKRETDKRKKDLTRSMINIFLQK